jgi:predicted PurR-regulated permease PerM
MAVLAVYYSLALFAAGFKLWLPVGVLTGSLIAIPYIGFALGLSFALIDGMLQLGPLKGLILVGIIYGIGQMLESFYLTPRLVGEQIGLHPLAVIIALWISLRSCWRAFGSTLGGHPRRRPAPTTWRLFGQ